MTQKQRKRQTDRINTLATHSDVKDLFSCTWVPQSTLVPAFNQVFADIETSERVEADSIGSPVVNWPTLDSITQLALRTYHRMHAVDT